MPGVLYITYDGVLEPLGASQVLPYVLALRERGHPMALLSFEKPGDAEGERFRDLAARLAEADVPWTRRRYHHRPTLPATAWDVARGRRVAAAWGRRNPGGLVHARGYVPGLMGLAAGAHGARHLFDMRGFWVDERIEGGYWGPDGPQARVGRWIERTVLDRTDHLVLLTRRAADRLADLAPGPVPGWTVVPTCVDLERFRPAADPAEARRRLGLEERGPWLVHVGTLTGWYDGEATLAVARAFLDRTGGRFAVLTRDTARAAELARAAGVECLVRSVAPAEMPRWLQAADAGLALVRPSPSKDASFPTKIGEYLATGLPTLATPVGDLASLADDVVLAVDGLGSPPEAAAAWLDEAVRDPSRGPRARALAEAHLSLEAGVERLDALYRRLAASGGRPA